MPSTFKVPLLGPSTLERFGSITKICQGPGTCGHVLKPGEAHISWDSAIHSKVMVRDPRTGEVIAFGENGSLDLITDAEELEVHFSDGVRGQRKLMKVQ